MSYQIFKRLINLTLGISGFDFQMFEENKSRRG